MKFYLILLLAFFTPLPLFAEPTEIRVFEPRVHTECAGGWVAAERGFYGNLPVQMLQEALDTSPFQNVVASVQEGKIAFGVGTPEDILRARERERLNLVAVSADFQSSPMRIISWKPIRSPKDLNGKFGVWNDRELKVKCAADKRRDKISITPQQPGEIKPWLAGAWPLASAMTYDELIIAQREVKKMGRIFYTLDYKDLGIDWVDHVLFTTEEVVKTYPEIVLAIVRARYKGFLWAFENFREALEILKKTDGQLSSGREIDALSPVKLLMITPETKRYGLGYIQPKKWEKLAKDLFKTGLLDRIPDVKSAFTESFPSGVLP